MAQTTEPVEAVIISGPQRGHIIKLDAEPVPAVTDDEIEALNQALDDLIAAVDRVSLEIRATTEALRPRLETS